jgi:predicted CxxxxCH...CXXCH cytochrome family protein
MRLVRAGTLAALAALAAACDTVQPVEPTAEVGGCERCHGYPPPPFIMGGTSHPASTDCSSCHPGTVEPDDVTIVPGGLHMNGIVDAPSSHPAGWGDPTQHGYSVNANGLASCKTCHGSSLQGGSGRACSACHGTGWDTSCTFCHGNPQTGRASPPVDTQGRSVTTNVSVGVHASHVTTTIATPLGCDECHPARTTSVITDANHIDGSANGADVSMGALARTGGAAATYDRTSATSATCSSVYCHGKFAYGVNNGAGATPSWTTGTVGCSSCHPTPPSSRRHGTHSSFGCNECHGAGYSTSTVNAATHVNGTKDVPFPGITGARFSGSNCGSFSCHGNGHSTGDTW